MVNNKRKSSTKSSKKTSHKKSLLRKEKPWINPNIVILAQAGPNPPPKAPPKLGPHGWPLDANGNEIIPTFCHANDFWMECWQKQPNEKTGVKGIIGGELFRWECDALLDEIRKLTDKIKAKFGNNSITNFRAVNHTGNPARCGPPTYPEGFDGGNNLNVPQVDSSLPPNMTPMKDRIIITIGTRWKFFDEEGANYMLQWLERQHAQCCI
ncbi:MAG: hypothetical protein ACT4OW_01215 [Nitrososphaerota archaeon]